MDVLIHCFLLFLFHECYFCNLLQIQEAHESQKLTSKEIKELTSERKTELLNETMHRIAIPRVVGSYGHEIVRNFIVNRLKQLNWHVDQHTFRSRTPNFGVLTFVNIIGSLNPKADRFLILACHYDSKYFDNFEFIGATDSAVPCAMMLHLIELMDNYFADMKSRTDLSLKLVFFDGEEAFLRWSPHDSIYGARKLAEDLNNSEVQLLNSNEKVSALRQWDLLVLLDLLGAPYPKFYSYFKKTDKWYLLMMNAEERLTKMHLLKSHSDNEPLRRYFQPESSSVYIEDDHLPFLKRGVPVLHLIPSPFPEVWHEEEDNMNVICKITVDNLLKIIQIFVAEYLHIKTN